MAICKGSTQADRAEKLEESREVGYVNCQLRHPVLRLKDGVCWVNELQGWEKLQLCDHTA